MPNIEELITIIGKYTINEDRYMYNCIVHIEKLVKISYINEKF